MNSEHINLNNIDNIHSDNEFYLEFDDDAETMIVMTKEENIDKISDDGVVDDVVDEDNPDINNIMFLEINKISESDLIIIEQIEFLINKGCIPQYIYPQNNVIDDAYIKLISNYLYRTFIYKKLYSEHYKKYNQTFEKSSSNLRKCATSDDLKKECYMSIQYELKLIDEICQKTLDINLQHKEYNQYNQYNQYDDFIV